MKTKETKNNKHLTVKILLGVLVTLLLLSLYIVSLYYKKAREFVSSFTSESEGVEQVVDIMETPFTVFISGIDTSGDVDNVSRSDVNMVVAINPVEEKVTIINIPRDFYVPIHGIGVKDKLTHTGIIGVENTVATVEDFLNIKIDYYVRLNFTSMKNLVEIIGGLTLDSDAEFTAWTDKGCHFVEGENKVDGRCALAFARERRSYLTGDMHRVENQGQVMQKIIGKLSDPVFFLNHYNDILNVASEHMRTNISEENLNKLINLQIYNQPNWQVERYALIEYGTYDYGYFMPSQPLWMGEPNWETVQVAHDKVTATLNISSDNEGVETVEASEEEVSRI